MRVLVKVRLRVRMKVQMGLRMSFMLAQHMEDTRDQHTTPSLLLPQAKLNSLYLPPRMDVGGLYAATSRTCALGLVYGPLYPYIYLLTALSLTLCYYSTRYAIATWYLKPAAVGEGMMDSMRASLAAAVGTMVTLQSLALLAAKEDSLGLGSTMAAVGSPACWLLYVATPWGRFPPFRGGEGGFQLEGDTEGMRYDEVMSATQIEMEPYVCPRLTAQTLKALEEEKEFVRNILAHADCWNGTRKRWRRSVKVGDETRAGEGSKDEELARSRSCRTCACLS